MKITYVNHGIGNNFGDEIELNENLLKYPELHAKVLEHELKHTDKIFSKKDLLLDIFGGETDSLNMLKFMFRNPRSFSQILPFYFTKKHGFVYDINLCLIYLFFVVVLGIGIFLGVFVI